MAATTNSKNHCYQSFIAGIIAAGIGAAGIGSAGIGTGFAAHQSFVEETTGFGQNFGIAVATTVVDSNPAIVDNNPDSMAHLNSSSTPEVASTAIGTHILEDDPKDHPTLMEKSYCCLWPFKIN